jgi:deferrochelatase/peroxidase EfeB
MENGVKGDGEQSGPPRFSRRSLFAGTTAAAAGLVTAGLVASEGISGAASPSAVFHGAHQAGIATPAQERLVFAAFDLTTSSKADLEDLLRTWTTAAARLAAGEPLKGPSDVWHPPADTGEATGLGASGLTLTVGFGRSMFDHRFGLRSRLPAALIEIPEFPGDDLDAGRSGGDLCIQACADDAQVAFHAIHNLARIATGTAALRWIQTGFNRTSSTSSVQETPRNLLGFKDGTNNLVAEDAASFDKFVWVGSESDQSWMRGGSYLVARRIRTHLEDWAATSLATQQDAIGRYKASGAPLTGHKEHDPVELDRYAPYGGTVIPSGAHIRVAAPHNNAGERILRRGYSFADGVDPATGELDAGLFFICFQKDPRAQFVRIQSNLAYNDSLRSYLVHTSSAAFACPPGVVQGGYWGESLFRAAALG